MESFEVKTELGIGTNFYFIIFTNMNNINNNNKNLELLDLFNSEKSENISIESNISLNSI